MATRLETTCNYMYVFYDKCSKLHTCFDTAQQFIARKDTTAIKNKCVVLYLFTYVTRFISVLNVELFWYGFRIRNCKNKVKKSFGKYSGEQQMESQMNLANLRIIHTVILIHLICRKKSVIFL